jgi:predicted alpha/beta hydrolase
VDEGEAIFRVETSDGWRLEVERVGAPAGAHHARGAAATGEAGAPATVAAAHPAAASAATVAAAEATPARAACIVGHAMMTNRRSLDRPRGAGLASTLAARGLAVYTFDCRGHGGSRDGAPRRSWTYDDVVLRDVPAVVAAVRARHPRLPLVVVGHSLVAHATLAWLGVVPGAAVHAVVALAAGVWIRRLEPDALAWLGKRATLEAWRAASVPLGYFPARRLGLGSEDVPRAYIEQFLGWARTDRWTAADGGDYLRGLARVRAPVLAIAGAADRFMCRPAAGRAFADQLTGAPVTFRVVERGELPGLRPDHMGLVTARAAAPLWGELAAWIERTV